MPKIILGKEEWVSLPLLGLPAIKARIDSGAQTSSLHALNIRPFERDGQKFVSFDIHPIQQNRSIILRAVAPLIGVRVVKPANGISERRYVVLTRMRLAEREWDIEITLSNRDDMGFRMLLGRQAMEGPRIGRSLAVLRHGRDGARRRQTDVRDTRRNQKRSSHCRASQQQGSLFQTAG